MSRWGEMSDPVRRALVGAGIGASAGAATGAIADKKHRVRGGLLGALAGGSLGALGGGLHGRFSPSAPGPTTVHGQALDNVSPDWFSVNGSHIDNQKQREEAFSRISSTAKRSKPAFESNTFGSIRVKRTGRHYIAEVDRGHRDTAGRKAPVVVHGTWSPGMSEKRITSDAYLASLDVPDLHTKEAGMNSRMFSVFVKEAMALQADQDTPGDYVMVKAATEAKFGKIAGLDHLELAGLGTLAAPAVAGLAGHPMKEKHKDIAEVAGLGILAAPYAHNIAAKRSARYAASGVGKRLSRVFSH